MAAIDNILAVISAGAADSEPHRRVLAQSSPAPGFELLIDSIAYL
jgi:hypothetical protein